MNDCIPWKESLGYHYMNLCRWSIISNELVLVDWQKWKALRVNYKCLILNRIFIPPSRKHNELQKIWETKSVKAWRWGKIALNLHLPLLCFEKMISNQLMMLVLVLYKIIVKCFLLGMAGYFFLNQIAMANYRICIILCPKTLPHQVIRGITG